MRTYIAFVILVVSTVAWAQEQSLAVPRLLRAEDLAIEVEPEALQRQYNALQAMRLETLKYSRRGPIESISGDTGVTLSSRVANLKEGDSGAEFLQLFKDILLASGNETLTVTRNSLQQMRFSQSIRGIPVINGGIGISYDDATKRVSALGANFVPDRGLEHTPRVSAERAEQIVPETLAMTKEGSAKEVEIGEGTHLAYYAIHEQPTLPKLVWVVRAQLEGGMQWVFYVSAITGMVVERLPTSQTLTRLVYNANNSSPNIPSGLPAPMTSGQITADPLAYEAHFDIGDADSILRQRLPLPQSSFPSLTKQIVRYMQTGPNAFHQLHGGTDYIAYSPAMVNANSATASPDVTYHEYAHGIALRTMEFGGDTFLWEFGALHESFADIAASAVDVALTGAPVTASWRIGEGFWIAPGTVARSMASPHFDSYPAPSGDWYPLRPFLSSSGHVNSTILSHAYYLSIYGGLHSRAYLSYIPDIAVPALDPVPAVAEQRARQIFMEAFDEPTFYLSPTFFEMKTVAMAKANSLYGSFARTSIQKAFEAVGVGYECTALPTSAPNFILEDLMCDGRFVVNWPDMPGVNRYIAQIAPQVYGWSFGQIAVDGDLNQCMPQISTPSMIRMRACNNCGCGPWSQTEYMYDWPGQCP